jgi:GH24 family phage-related lysozyme (muramidase)
MRQSVRDYFNSFSTKFEGRLPFMYLDVKGLVTTGIGNLIDPIGSAMVLPWVHKSDDSPASATEISQEWNDVKNHQEMAPKGGSYFGSMTQLKLTDEAIDSLILSKLDENERYLKNRFPQYDNWPADAQLGVLSMAWAMGPGFKFPRFETAINARPPDFDMAAVESHMNDTGNPGLVPRNAANVLLFRNASSAVTRGMPFDTLYYPLDASTIPAQSNWKRWAIGGAAVLVLISGTLLARHYLNNPGEILFGKENA